MQAVSGECPNCICQPRISTLKFGLDRTHAIFVCPNCAIVIEDEWRSPKGGTDIAKTPVSPLEASLQETLRMMEMLNTRVKYIVRFVVAAVIVAAFLRHTAHTYAVFSREEIRAGALTVCSVFSLALLLWRGGPHA